MSDRVKRVFSDILWNPALAQLKTIYLPKDHCIDAGAINLVLAFEGASGFAPPRIEHVDAKR